MKTLTQTESAQEVEAGRELDAQIAEKVLGLEVVRVELDPAANYIAHAEPGNPAAGWWFVADYSTEIYAAWEVVEKMKADDFWPSMTWKSGVIEGDWSRAVWFVRFRCVRGGTRGDHWAADESLPLAICKAALKVVEQAQPAAAKQP